jgi:DNA-binding NarL/FixJ family response regulator
MRTAELILTPVSPSSRIGRGEGSGTLRVLVAAGYPAVRAGLVALLGQSEGIQPVEATPGFLETTEHAPDAIVVDVSSTGDEAIDALEDAYPQSPLVFIGGNPAADGPGLSAGAVAYLPPDADAATLAAAVRGVALGLTVIDPALIVAAGVHVHSRGGVDTGTTSGEPLTAREREVLELVAAGLPNKTIARELGISEHTAKFHVGSLLAKLGAASRTEAVTIATRRGLLAV